ncbi:MULTISPECIES: sirohydrochlorin chelatase [Trichocoleus]|uniref:Sirohydrochlorin chelatase n=1 Tax=Trichocoleus desertorum GB2-A4 TaxID=2933944 RepID=A0ABV0J6A1_9CYAN|nr:CbiX/SirB N-terminal domain-containing protein [Trichocoleus sp. FACHB-46]MBD1863428.1 sirohydrochlorin chelatase [Trichocoleus sp. FACHB-46]
MNLPSAYLLVFHGSRDPRPAIAVEQLALLVSKEIQQRYHLWDEGQDVAPRLSYVGSPYSAEGWLTPTVASTPATISNPRLPLVGTACLELGPQPLHQQIQQFGDRILALKRQQVLQIESSLMQLVPLFLLPGVHVMEDIPTEVELAQTALDSHLNLQICPYLGTHPNLVQLLANQMAAASVDVWILLSHGSRRPEANAPIEAIATQLKAMPAYWSVPPNLESTVADLVQMGHHRVGILPYFLFAGGITDAIAQLVTRLSWQFPEIELTLAEPIGTSPALASLVLDLALSTVPS